MRLGKVLGIGGFVIVAICASAQYVHAQGGAQKPDAAQSGQPAGQKEKKEEKKEGEKNDVEKKAGAQTPAGIQWTKAIEGILDKLMSWVLVALVFVVLFRAELAALLDRVTQAMGDRGVTLEAGKVKIQISERTQDVLYEERGRRFSVSPFDLQKDRFEGFSDSADVPPQLTFQVSDYVGQYRKKEKSERAHAEEAATAFDALESGIGGAASLKGVKPELVKFARALEKARFVEATRLKKLLEGHPNVRDALVALARTAPPGDDERMILHAAGVAYAQSGTWSMARVLLEPIAWVAEKPGYLPAADVWLASMYHDCIKTARSPGSTVAPDAFLEKVRSTADDVVSKAEQVDRAMQASGALSSANAAYYQREVKKVLGIVLGIRAEYSEPEVCKAYLRRAFDAYGACMSTIAGEAPSPLDHNNLADAYRLLGRFDKSQYDQAHREIGVALRDSPEDPTFLNTQASIFISEEKLVEALDVLTQVPPGQMAGARADDVVQYVDNQILAAKVASRTDRPDTLRFSQAADILETAGHFLASRTVLLEGSDVTRLTAELNELLGFIYLGLPGYERRSVECFECVAQLWDKVEVTADIRWRRRLGGVRAYTWLARVSRRDFDYGTAADQRKCGRKVINDNVAELAVFDLKAGQPAALRLRHASVQLDTAMALQGLAEESFHGGELNDTKELLDKKDGILAALRDFRDDKDIGEKIRLASAHTGLLRGRLAFQSDPGTYEPAALTTIEKNFLAARGHVPLLDCQIDLALGEAFLAAALAGKGDAAANYRKAIDALELAVGREAPALRADAVRALVDAHGRRWAVPRPSKESKRV
jgi:hypothetical protein